MRTDYIQPEAVHTALGSARHLVLIANDDAKRCDVLLELADAKPRKKAPAVFTYRRGWKAAA